MIAPNAVIVAVEDQVSSELADEAVILNLKNGTYYGLDPVGARIWELVQQPKTVEAVRDQLMEEYDVEQERCEKDLVKLLLKLENEGLIEIRKAKVHDV